MATMSILRVSLVLALFTGVSCGSDDDDDSGSSAPSLGTMIDRAGRAAVSTALISPYEANDDKKNSAKNGYNEAAESEWVDYVANIAGNLAILDGIDRNCKNSFYNDGDNAKGAYDNLATALADDRLYVNGAQGTCKQYLAVEVNVVLEAGLKDCGGRTPTMDVVETTYSALVKGELSGTDDTVSTDDKEHSNTAFPFLAAP